jgi:hypothetical protein
MQLAADNVIEFGRVRMSLRPTLWAAIRLDRAHGLQGLVRGITDGSLSVMSDILRESADPSEFDPNMLLVIGPDGLGTTLGQLQGPMLRHVFALYGIDPDHRPARPKAPTKAKLSDPFAELFSIATGVLGWSPETAYAASPAEIIEANRGRTRFVNDLLRTIFGGKAEDAPEAQLHAELDREGLAALKAMAA